MLWSQIIYGHRTTSISPKIVRFPCPAGGRKNLTIFCQLLDIVRCPVKFGYSTPPVRAFLGPLRVKNICTHRTGTGGFLFQILIVRFQWRPSLQRTTSEKRQEHRTYQPAVVCIVYEHANDENRSVPGRFLNIPVFADSLNRKVAV